MIILNGGSYYPDSKAIDCYWTSKISKRDMVVFIPSATTKSQEEYYKFFKQNISAYGITNIECVDLYNDWSKAQEAKVVYIAGGNTYKLMDIIRKSGFEKFLRKEHHNICIVGNSAGAVVLGKDIRTTNDNDIIGLNNTSGVGLIDYSVCPHYIEDKYNRLLSLSNVLDHKIFGIPEKCGLVFNNSKIHRIGLIREIVV